MKIWALSDTHLSFDSDKPMDIFGDGWSNYAQKIEENWRKKVGENDIVLVAGDISWALKLENAKADLNFLGSLPGTKIIIKGNHELWWNSLTKVKEVLPKSIIALQNNSVKINNCIFCGTRGWQVREVNKPYTEQDQKIFDREVIRLNLTLEDMEKRRNEGDIVFCMFHFPPYNAKFEDTAFTKLFEEHNVDYVIYGHLHGKNNNYALSVLRHNIKYFLTSTDQINHDPVLIYDDGKE
ncbi:MAG: metallophosphoesterase [Clostridia bacterium]|nr:metallophosphoesterase [Clostridia bacterium]